MKRNDLDKWLLDYFDDPEAYRSRALPLSNVKLNELFRETISSQLERLEKHVATANRRSTELAPLLRDGQVMEIRDVDIVLAELDLSALCEVFLSDTLANENDHPDFGLFSGQLSGKILGYFTVVGYYQRVLKRVLTTQCDTGLAIDHVHLIQNVVSGGYTWPHGQYREITTIERLEEAIDNLA